MGYLRLIDTNIILAGEPGFEPRLTESESAVLPLNYSPTPSGWPSGYRTSALNSEARQF
jgi:hypothetical protein